MGMATWSAWIGEKTERSTSVSVIIKKKKNRFIIYIKERFIITFGRCHPALKWLLDCDKYSRLLYTNFFSLSYLCFLNNWLVADANCSDFSQHFFISFAMFVFLRVFTFRLRSETNTSVIIRFSFYLTMQWVSSAAGQQCFICINWKFIYPEGTKKNGEKVSQQGTISHFTSKHWINCWFFIRFPIFSFSF